MMRKCVGIFLVVTALFGVGMCTFAVVSYLLPPRHDQTATEEWVFEQYFEDRGGGVYHVEGSDWLQRQPSPFTEKPEPDDPAKVRSTRDVATILGEWQRRHHRRIVAFHIDMQDFTLILVTEPR